MARARSRTQPRRRAALPRICGPGTPSWRSARRRLQHRLRFLHRSGSGGSREIATINAPEGPVKVKPTAETDRTRPTPAARSCWTARSTPPVKKVVTNQEQAVDPTVTPNASSSSATDRSTRRMSLRAAATASPKQGQDRHRAAGRQPGRRWRAAAGRRHGDQCRAPARSPSPAPSRRARPSRRPSPATTARRRSAKPKPRRAEGRRGRAAVRRRRRPTPPRRRLRRNGGFAVQFGAADSEADARELLKTVVRQISSQLAEADLQTGQGRRQDRLSRARRGREQGVRERDLQQGQGAGGSCFVAGN